VAIASRDEELFASLTAPLGSDGSITLLRYPGTDSHRLLPWLEGLRAHVLLLDERLLAQLRSRFGQRLRARLPRLRVLILGRRANAGLAEEVVRNGFQGLLVAGDGADTCLKAVRAVGQEELWMPRVLLTQLLERWYATHRARLRLEVEKKLTRREAQVVRHLRCGLANKQIADTLAIREDTVKKHLLSAYAKLGVHRRSELIVMGQQ
jgi:DNA-binding NarL/FixJ family response regulator